MRNCNVRTYFRRMSMGSLYSKQNIVLALRAKISFLLFFLFVRIFLLLTKLALLLQIWNFLTFHCDMSRYVL